MKKIVCLIIFIFLVFGFIAASKPRSSKWETTRKEWLKHHPNCAACNSAQYVNVHHVKPFQYYPELENDMNNLITLCETPTRNCHLNIGHSGDWKAWNPHVREDAALAMKRRKERKYSR